MYLSMITWEYVRFLRDLIKVPFGLKGIMHPDDACASLDCGLDFIWISNHGGRQLDSGRATIDALPRVAAAIGNRAPIIVDGGFRRGTDIIKGLALGATIVAIGRPYMWGLAHGGAEGAEAISRLLEAELRVDMALSGLTSRAQNFSRRGGLRQLLKLRRQLTSSSDFFHQHFRLPRHQQPRRQHRYREQGYQRHLRHDDHGHEQAQPA